MANSFGITVSQRRPYRNMPTEPSTSLPTVTPRSFGKRFSRANEISDAVNKEKWTFLQRLLAIEEKHEKKKMARKKESSPKRDEAEVDVKPENDPIIHGRWISEQILNDSRGPSPFLEEPHSYSIETSTRATNGSSTNSSSLVVSSLPSIKQEANSSHDSDSKFCQIIDSPTELPYARASDESHVSHAKRKRPLRLPPILLPPLYTMQPRPLREREFLSPTRVRGPITDAEWEELCNCRYIRHPPSKYALQLTSSQSSFFY